MRPSIVAGISLLALGVGCQRDASSTAGPPSSPQASPSAPAWLENVTERIGLRFTHVAGTNYFMPDQVGNGAALLDYDGDGRLDLYLVQNGGTNSSVRNQLFHHEADGKFRDVSAGSGLDISG